MEVNKLIRNKITERLLKVFSKLITYDIEKGLVDFSEQYAETQGTSFLIDQIYEDKSEEILCYFENNINKELIVSIKNNKIVPLQVAYLKPQELNPDKYEKITKKKELEELNKNQASTDIYKCSKCKKNRCKTEEKQTRAGDEPATLFVECLECKNKWRIG